MQYLKKRTDLKPVDISEIMSKIYAPGVNIEIHADDKMIELI